MLRMWSETLQWMEVALTRCILHLYSKVVHHDKKETAVLLRDLGADGGVGGSGTDAGRTGGTVSTFDPFHPEVGEAGPPGYGGSFRQLELPLFSGQVRTATR